MDEYRIVIRVKNNLLHQLMKSRGISTQAELARAAGVGLQSIGEVANLRVGAFLVNGQPSRVTQALCDYFGCLPEDIYPAEVLRIGVPSNVVECVVGSEEVARYIGQAEQDPILALERTDEKELIAAYITRLTPMEQRVIHARFYREDTLKDTADAVNLTTERVRQIELKALRKMRGMAHADREAGIVI